MLYFAYGVERPATMMVISFLFKENDRAVSDFLVFFVEFVFFFEVGVAGVVKFAPLHSRPSIYYYPPFFRHFHPIIRGPYYMFPFRLCIWDSLASS